MSSDEVMSLPTPESCPIVTVNRTRCYKTPIGHLPSVTTKLKVLGLGTNALVAWSANTERAAILEACAEVYAEGVDGGPADFAAAVEARIGHAKQHQKILTQAGEIGTSIHAAIQRRMAELMGQEVGPEPALSDQAQWAFMAFEDWWKASGLKPVRSEQPIYDETLRYAGTIDLIAEDPKLGLGIVDFKTSKYVYDEHHLQVAAYCHAARNWVDIRWAKIVRFPKNITDPQFEIVELGQMYDRKLTELQLIEAFCAASAAWDILLAKGGS